MSDTLYGVPLEIIKTNHHLGIMISNFLKVAKFPVYRFLGIKAPGSSIVKSRTRKQILIWIICVLW